MYLIIMKTKHGFTLVELAITLAVAVVILAVGIPVFSTMIANNRAAADSNALVTAFQLARSEAVKRGEQVKVCAGGDGSPTPTACSGANDWAKGLLVRVTSSDETLRVWDVFKGADDLVDVTPKNPVDLTEVSFSADGSVSGGVCLQLTRKAEIGGVVRVQTQRWLAVDTTGRTRVVSKRDCDTVETPLGPCPASTCPGA